MANGRILVVEDEELLQSLVARVLRGAGYEAESVGSAEEGLLRWRRRPFDLLLVDLKLPGEGGFEFIGRVRAQDPLTPVLVISGYAALEEAVRGLELGIQGLLRKPVMPARLLQAVSGALERRRRLEEAVRLRLLPGLERAS